MSDFQGSGPAGSPPPPAGYQAPPAPPAPPVPPAYPAPGAYPPPAPKKSKTMLWVVIGLVVLGLIGAGIAAFLLLGGAGPAKTIELLNQAALDEDEDEVEKYIDIEEVARNMYPIMVDMIMEMPDFAEVIEMYGEDEARGLIESQMSENQFADEMSGEFGLDGEEPFANYKVKKVEISGSTAEVTLTADNPEDDDETIEWVLGMEKRDGVWVIVEFKNIEDLFEELGILE
jgi:hypothetical protein